MDQNRLHVARRDPETSGAVEAEGGVEVDQAAGQARVVALTVPVRSPSKFGGHVEGARRYLFTALSQMALLLLILVAMVRSAVCFDCVFTVSATTGLTEFLAAVAAATHPGFSFPVLPSSLIVARVTSSRGAQISAFA